MSDVLTDSVEFCTRLARRTGKNFYYSFLTLPKALRRDMCVLYAFMRETDDIGDDESQSIEARGERLAEWKRSLERMVGGKSSDHPLMPALADLVARKRIPPEYLFDVIAGVEMDLSPRRFETFDELQEYCYRVAGAVGLCCIHVWGFRDEEAVEPAIDCGTAFQLTNILRDMAEDSERGRVYLPQEDLRRFRYTEEDVAGKVINPPFRELMRFEVRRARQYYKTSELLFEHLSDEGKPILRAMRRIYGGILDRIESADYDVYSRRISLPRVRKWGIVLRSMCGW